ncbi:MAG: hypothetical protein EZS28_044658, partial [Streblomastix strix]
MLNGFDLIPVRKNDEGQYWSGFGPGIPHATDWRKSKQQGQTRSMDDIRAFWRKHNFDLRVTCRNLEIDSADIEIGLCHRITRDQDMTLLTEEVIRESGQDQEVIRDRETVKIQEQLEWISIEIRMDLRPEAKREAEAVERLEEGILTIKVEDKASRIENNHIKRDIEKRNSITHIQNRSQIRQRINQTGIGYTNMITVIEEKAGMTTQMMSGQNIHKCKKILLKTIIIEIQTGQKMKSLKIKLQLLNPNNLSNKHNENNTYMYNQNNRAQSKHQDKEVEKMHRKIKTTLMKKKYYKTSQLHYKKRKNNMIVSLAPRMTNTGMNRDKSSTQTQRPDTSTQKTTHREGIKQRQKIIEREFQQLHASQQVQQQGNNDFNKLNVDIYDIQGSVKQLT